MVITSRLLPLKKQAAYSDYLVNFQRAQPLKSGQFSVRGNNRWGNRQAHLEAVHNKQRQL